MTETDHDLSTIEHLDFSSELECDLDDCLNIATWSKEYLCCARELKSCNECRMRAFAQWRAHPYRRCQLCYFEWDASKVINVKWTRI